MSPDSFRYKVLDAARGFKSSWIELGQYLYTVYKDKLFKDWGYLAFETYCSKEIGIRQNTALKLLRSYHFLEREEPAFVKREFLNDKGPNEIPGLESVNALRLAKDGGRITERDYRELKADILESPKEESAVKKKIRTYVLKNAFQKPEDKEASKTASLKKLLVYLRGSRHEISALEAPRKLIQQMDVLIDLLEDYTN